MTITNSTGASNLRISGNNTSRVFYLDVSNLTINGVTITGGNGTGRFSIGSGGAIYSDSGTLILTNSTVSGNTASSNGGGVYNHDALTLTLTSSTISGNTASSSGGISSGGQTTLTNSTVSGNTSTSNYGAGGIFNQDGSLNLTGVTVTDNHAPNTGCQNCAGGVYNFNSTAYLNNTIVAANTTGNAASSPDFGGAVAAGSAFNLIGNGFGMTGIANGDANSNQVGSAMSPIDPRLAPLANNGGATQTHALLAASPAIDKGKSFGLTTDQRGLARPVDLLNAIYPNATGGDGSDIGAYELQLAPTAATVSISGRVMTASGRGIMNVHLSLTDTNGQVRTATTASLGYYRFDDVQAGETYILSAAGKHYTFSQPVRVLNINEETSEVNFIANSEKSIRIFNRDFDK